MRSRGGRVALLAELAHRRPGGGHRAPRARARHGGLAMLSIQVCVYSVYVYIYIYIYIHMYI